MAAEREARLQKEKADREEKEAEKARLAEEEKQRNIETSRMHYYRYARRTLFSAQEPVLSKDYFRIGFRLPDGRRIIRNFSGDDDLTALYSFAATLLIPAELPEEKDPLEPPAEFANGLNGLNEELWSFKLALTYPRKEVDWAPGVPLSSIDGLKGGAQLVVEMKKIPTARSRASLGREANGDSDEYDTEEE